MIILQLVIKQATVAIFKYLKAMKVNLKTQVLNIKGCLYFILAFSQIIPSKRGAENRRLVTLEHLVSAPLIIK